MYFSHTDVVLQYPLIISTSVLIYKSACQIISTVLHCLLRWNKLWLLLTVLRHLAREWHAWWQISLPAASKLLYKYTHNRKHIMTHMQSKHTSCYYIRVNGNGNTLKLALLRLTAGNAKETKLLNEHTCTPDTCHSTWSYMWNTIICLV